MVYIPKLTLIVELHLEKSFVSIHVKVIVFPQLWLFPANPFSLDVKFNDDGDRIVASRFLVQAINISGTNHEKEMVKALRQVVAESPLNASVFHPYFVFFDQVGSQLHYFYYIIYNDTVKLLRTILMLFLSFSSLSS